MKWITSFLSHRWRLFPSMNRCYMLFDGTPLRTAVVTYVILEWLLSFMNSWNMFVHITRLISALVTHKCLIWMAFSIHELIVHVTLLRSAAVTNCAFEFCLFSSWTVPTCQGTKSQLNDLLHLQWASIFDKN